MSWLNELWGKRPVRMITWVAIGSAAIVAVVPSTLKTFRKLEARAMARADRAAEPPDQQPRRPSLGDKDPGTIRLTADQQAAIGLQVAPAESSPATERIEAPGRVTPDESRYAYITPRAAGVVRTVAAQIGQDVRDGQLLATIDSPEVAQARLDLLNKEQMLEVARAKADWQEKITSSTLELIDRLRANDSPEEIRRRFEGRPIGADRERLMTADAQRRLTWTALQRNKDLFENDAVSLSKYQLVVAEYESALATYQGLMDRVGVETRMANTLAQQDRRAAMTADRVARERLRVLGVPAEPDEPEAGPKPAEPNPTATLPPPSTDVASGKSQPLSTYTIRAPFDGTILDREMIVPGVAVGTTQKIFTMADLRTVWVEASVHEGDFATLDRVRSRGGKLRFRSPAYPGRVFEGEVIYTGDLVEEKSRSVKLLAKAENPDRLLRPGMFVEVDVLSPRAKEALRIPTSALLIEDDRTFVYVRSGPDLFRRREVEADAPREETVMIRSGLVEGDEVVIEGGFKLKALAERQPAEEG